MNWRKSLHATEPIGHYYPGFTKSLRHSTPTKSNNHVKKWEKEMSGYFSKEEIQIANRHLKNPQAP